MLMPGWLKTKFICEELDILKLSMSVALILESKHGQTFKATPGTYDHECGTLISDDILRPRRSVILNSPKSLPYGVSCKTGHWIYHQKIFMSFPFFPV